MAGNTLTTSTSMQCPHGGIVQVVSSNTVSRAAGAPVLRATDAATVSGCPFTLPSGTPSPCAQVKWTVTDAKVTVRGDPTLSTSSLGLCLSGVGAPQGTVVIVSTQPKVSSR